MALCTYCSAPLPANINTCDYCGVRNDVDLHGKHDFCAIENDSNRICPHCDVALQTIRLNSIDALSIERCDTCFGLFFDPGEIEILLENSVSRVFEINRKQIENINKDRYQRHKKVKYIKCPVCRVLMNRVSFGHKSGVVVDRCRSHGIWLDSGEITHLLEWKKAGGQLFHEKQASRRKKIKPKCNPIDSNKFTTTMGIQGRFDKHYDDDLFESISSVVFKLFK